MRFLFSEPILHDSHTRSLTVKFIIASSVIFLGLSALSCFVVLKSRNAFMEQSFYRSYEMARRIDQMGGQNESAPGRPPGPDGGDLPPMKIWEEEYMITPRGTPVGRLRYTGQQIERIDSPLTERLRKERDRNNHDLIIIKHGYLNYAGIKVYGGGFWMESSNKGFIIEIRASEINKMPLRILTLIMGILLSCVLIYLYLIIRIDRLRLQSLAANPLTHMPGNKSINAHIQDLISRRRHAAVVYGDLDNFKAYNDTYGFSMGDEVIKFTADVLRECLSADSSSSAFCGHIGGDDFVFCASEDKIEEIAGEIRNRFQEGIVEFYNKDDVAAGGITAKCRDGREKTFPLMALSMAGVLISENSFTHFLEVTNVCSELKKVAKEKPGSTLVMDRRHHRS